MKRKKAPVDDSSAAGPFTLSPPLPPRSSDTIGFTWKCDSQQKVRKPPSDDIQYPNLQRALAESLAGNQKLASEPLLRQSSINGRAAAIPRDKKSAKLIQREERGAYDGNSLFERLRNAEGSSPPTRLSGSSRTALMPSTSGTSQQSGHRGTRDDPIEIYSDSDDGGGPVVRQQELSIQLRDCIVCGNSTPIVDFPALVNCEHEPETCPSCFATWIAAELENKGWKDIKCPGPKCRILLAHHDIRQYATTGVFDRYDDFATRAVLSDEPGFRWCKADCGSGQIHLSGEEGNIFTCIGCGHRFCIVHEGKDTWHEGETCEEYDYQVSRRQKKDQNAQEKASLDVISRLSKRCPGEGCNFNIEKNGGCDHMTCSQCRYEFCWVCLADYNNIRGRGNAAHAKTCIYHTSRIG